MEDRIVAGRQGNSGIATIEALAIMDAYNNIQQKIRLMLLAHEIELGDADA